MKTLFFFLHLWLVHPNLASADCDGVVPSLDVVFLLDVSGSKQSYANLLVEKVPNIINDIEQRFPGSAYGVATFNNKPRDSCLSSGLNRGENYYCARIDSPLDEDRGVSSLAFLKTVITSDNDVDEASKSDQLTAIMKVAANMNWRDSNSTAHGVQRVVIVVTDKGYQQAGDPWACFEGKKDTACPVDFERFPDDDDKIATVGCDKTDYPSFDQAMAKAKEKNLILIHLTTSDMSNTYNEIQKYADGWAMNFNNMEEKELGYSLVARLERVHCSPRPIESRVSFNCETVLFKVDLYLNDIDLVKNVPSYTDCAISCRGKKDCMYWTWNKKNHNCWRKTNADGHMINERGISGNRECTNFDPGQEITTTLKPTTPAPTTPKPTTPAPTTPKPTTPAPTTPKPTTPAPTTPAPTTPAPTTPVPTTPKPTTAAPTTEDPTATETTNSTSSEKESNTGKMVVVIAGASVGAFAVAGTVAMGYYISQGKAPAPLEFTWDEDPLGTETVSPDLQASVNATEFA